MKKYLLTLIFIFCIFVLSAQVDTIRLKERAGQNLIITDRPPQAVYGQIGGSAPLLSLNYDRRFANRVNGPGFAVGLGFWGLADVAVFSVPVSLNCLIGRQSHFVEIAAGATYITATVGDDFYGKPETGNIVVGHLNAGYRLQPSKGGFFLRVGISPLFYRDGGTKYLTSHYAGFGYNF